MLNEVAKCSLSRWYAPVGRFFNKVSRSGADSVANSQTPTASTDQLNNGRSRSDDGGPGGCCSLKVRSYVCTYGINMTLPSSLPYLETRADVVGPCLFQRLSSGRNRSADIPVQNLPEGQPEGGRRRTHAASQMCFTFECQQ